MCRSVGGSITPITGWLQCADHALAPLCRSSSGSYVPVGDIGTKKLRNMGEDLGGAVKGFRDGMKEAEATAQLDKPGS